jgi:quinoprotein glucose dehydrogenase
LDEITTENVRDLETAWTYGPEAAGGGGRGGRGAAADPDGPVRIGAATPIVVDGVMYVPGGSNVVALDAATGRELWRTAIEDGNPSPRGVAYWPGNGNTDGRIVFMAGERIIALDRAKGEFAREFGGDGIVELAVSYNGVPTIIGDIVVIGAYNAELSQGGPDGDTRAFDAVSGDFLWSFEPHGCDRHLQR